MTGHMAGALESVIGRRRSSSSNRGPLESLAFKFKCGNIRGYGLSRHEIKKLIHAAMLPNLMRRGGALRGLG